MEWSSPIYRRSDGDPIISLTYIGCDFSVFKCSAFEFVLVFINMIYTFFFQLCQTIIIPRYGLVNTIIERLLFIWIWFFCLLSIFFIAPTHTADASRQWTVGKASGKKCRSGTLRSSSALSSKYPSLVYSKRTLERWVFVALVLSLFHTARFNFDRAILSGKLTHQAEKHNEVLKVVDGLWFCKAQLNSGRYNTHKKENPILHTTPGRHTTSPPGGNFVRCLGSWIYRNDMNAASLTGFARFARTDRF